MTDEDYKVWLSSPSALKCVLVEIGVSISGSISTLYLSNRGYTTSPTDTPANTAYLPVLKSGLEISSSLNIDGSPSISWGDIEVNNPSGELDPWLGYIWKNKNITVYLGDMTWDRSDFRVIFSGKVDDLTSRNRDTLNIQVRDKMQALNTSMSEVKLGGTTSNKDNLIPLCFGECHNVEPLLIDPVLLKYQVHNGAIEDIIEVRDNGVPVSITKNNAAGTFTLTNSPIGTITASVQGAKFGGTYYNTVSNLIKNIVKTYGLTPFSDSDLDLSNFSSFQTNNPQPVGIYLKDKANVISVVTELAASVGAQVTMTPLGKLQVLKIDPTITTETSSIYKKDIKENSFIISDKVPVVAAVNLNYCKNYVVQEGLQSGLPPEHLSMFAKEWFEAKVSDSSVASAYSLSTEVEYVDTLLLVTTDATTEAQRRLDMYKTQRYVYRIESDLSLLLTNLGEYVKIYNDRFGFNSGKVTQVISIDVNWFDNRMEMRLLT